MLTCLKTSYRNIEAGKLPGSLPITAIAAVIATLLTSGCASSNAPCLQYTPTTMTRVVSLRGHGSVAMTTEAYVCSERAEMSVAGR